MKKFILFLLAETIAIVAMIFIGILFLRPPQPSSDDMIAKQLSITENRLSNVEEVVMRQKCELKKGTFTPATEGQSCFSDDHNCVLNASTLEICTVGSKVFYGSKDLDFIYESGQTEQF